MSKLGLALLAKLIRTDANNRFVTDAEKALIAAALQPGDAIPATDVTTDVNNRFVTDAEKALIAAALQPGDAIPATDVTTDANNRFVTDAEKGKISGAVQVSSIIHSPGYLRIPKYGGGNIIIQWGNVYANPGTAVQVTFPLTFGSVDTVIAVSQSGSVVYVTQVTGAGFKLTMERVVGIGGGNNYWLALGI